jgi:hypothetical protein
VVERRPIKCLLPTTPFWRLIPGLRPRWHLSQVLCLKYSYTDIPHEKGVTRTFSVGHSRRPVVNLKRQEGTFPTQLPHRQMPSACLGTHVISSTYGRNPPGRFGKVQRVFKAMGTSPIPESRSSRDVTQTYVICACAYKVGQGKRGPAFFRVEDG